MLGLAEASGIDPVQLFYRADRLDKLAVSTARRAYNLRGGVRCRGHAPNP
jgi:hypothetical protein